MTQIIDLRSDTVTLPTQEMIDAVSSARLGDDVQREDLTTNELEELAARMLGKEAGLFVASGTMGNLVSLMAQTPFRKGEIVAESMSHIITSEAGGYAHVAGLAMRAVEGHQGEIPPEKIEKLVRDPQNPHHPRSALVSLENTHNASGGTVLSLENMRQIRAVTKRHNIRMHLDGARIFNAALALGVAAKDIAAEFDSVQICLTKGLSAPFGSLVVGDQAFIKEARHMRKILGGGMRQCGFMAAAGIVALTSMVGRLAEDHANARLLGEGILEIPPLQLDFTSVQTNMVRIETEELGVPAAEFVLRLKEAGVLALAQGKYVVRFVTHRHVTAEMIESALQRIKQTVSKIRGAA